MAKTFTRIDPSLFPHMLPLDKAFNFTHEEREELTERMLSGFGGALNYVCRLGFGDPRRIPDNQWQTPRFKMILRLEPGYRTKEDAMRIVSSRLGKSMLRDVEGVFLFGDERLDPKKRPNLAFLSCVTGLVSRAETEGDVVDMCGFPITVLPTPKDFTRVRVNNEQVVEYKTGSPHFHFKYAEREMATVGQLSGAPYVVVRFSVDLSLDNDADLKLYKNTPVFTGDHGYPPIGKRGAILVDDESSGGEEISPID